ncbi:MAG: HEAT repeat domain-containing protein [Halanaerobiales bacterium]|nr:HEAT repeat domain-containing protein [Halanaerobiales bacterium]
MELLASFLSRIYFLLRQYPLYYFSLTGLLFVFMVFLLVREKYSKKLTINKIRSLLLKNPERALEKLIGSDLAIIDYFLDQDNLDSAQYIAVKKYLNRIENVKKIYLAVLNSTGKRRKNQIELGISIFTRLSVPQAADYLITFLYEDNLEIINLVIDGLATFKSDKVIYSLIEYLAYTKDSNVLAHMKELFKKAGTAVADKLTTFIYQSDPTIIIWCVDIIGEYQNEKFQQILVNLLDSDNPEVKIHVIQKLANYQVQEEISDKIIESLHDSNWGVRSQSAKTLGKLQLLKAAPFLAEALTDNSAIVRISATEALLNLGYNGIKYIFALVKNPEAPKEVIDILKEQNIPFLIEALEHIYLDNIESIDSNFESGVS